LTLKGAPYRAELGEGIVISEHSAWAGGCVPKNDPLKDPDDSPKVLMSDKDDVAVEELLEGSSFGDSLVKDLSDRTPDDIVERITHRVSRLGEEDGEPSTRRGHSDKN
jgi:hypothetical protein